jgi:hypothetical protein
MFKSALGAMRLPHSLAGLDLRRRYPAHVCRVSAPKVCAYGPHPPVPVLLVYNSVPRPDCLRA